MGETEMSHICVAAGCLLIGFGFGISFTESAMQQDAIAAGVASWHINPTTGETKFVYKTP